ncbi:MAG: PhzF family phenazine biosynthesis protein [Deltaproteobacteria bacterium]|nr:PhzF family phenazine biosynthesis protein [Deltaproteobacteria bacterium]
MRFFQVDAFTATPFAGNPAAVLVLPAPAPDRWMQQVASEMNLSETAYLVPRGADYDLRWFTPATEVDLCGHATLASAHVLWTEGFLDPAATARFHTRSGLLTAARQGEWIELDFPATPAAPAPPPAGLLAALGATSAWVGLGRFDYLVLLRDEAEVRGLAPDHRALRRLGVRGVIVTAAATMPGYDFVSRFFAAGVDIDEDPVTGSAHCTLGPFWRERLGRDEMVAYQASARGGVVKVRVAGERVRLAGQAVTVARGELLC